ncbi:MAG: tRNA pseudouridine(55) synthase TruB, partial [Gammaproteobacteria bacterium]
MIDGILPVDKPRGISSARAVAKLKSAFAAKKAGHGGTLDPLADGLLVVLFGQATGFSRFCLGADKTYRAKVCFGAQTETDDSEGAVIFSSIPPPDLAQRVRKLLPDFIGEISQTAPQYSALKHRGEPLYKKARRGEKAIAKTRILQVADIKMVEDIAGVSECVLSFDIRAQSGFYVRAFARDIGAKIGCGAHLAALTRLASGVFSLSDAAP